MISPEYQSRFSEDYEFVSVGDAWNLYKDFSLSDLRVLKNLLSDEADDAAWEREMHEAALEGLDDQGDREYVHLITSAHYLQRVETDLRSRLQAVDYLLGFRMLSGSKEAENWNSGDINTSPSMKRAIHRVLCIAGNLSSIPESARTWNLKEFVTWCADNVRDETGMRYATGTWKDVMITAGCHSPDKQGLEVDAGHLIDKIREFAEVHRK